MAEVEWGKFKVSDLFNVYNSKPHHKNQLKTDSKGIPYITRTNTENGLNDTVKYTGSLNPKNVITVGAENAKFFAQPYTFITGNKMYYIAEKKQSLSFKQCLFLTCLFQNSFGENQYGYGLGLTGTRVMRGIIILPIVSPDEPDWHYMEQYIINEIEKHRVPELEEPKDSPIDGLKSIFETDFKRHSEPRLPSTAQINHQLRLITYLNPGKH
nr:restriction endonuclease subunit S [Lacticaseibacillus paracasei]